MLLLLSWKFTKSSMAASSIAEVNTISGSFQSIRNNQNVRLDY